MKKARIGFTALATTLVGGASVAQAQDGLTVGGHIGFVLPLVTQSGGQTINNLTDQFSIGFPLGITLKGSGRIAFDFEVDPFINIEGDLPVRFYRPVNAPATNAVTFATHFGVGF
jgi:hypothetical protein